MRLIERRNVDFPQPDGPISAVTVRGATTGDVEQRLLLAIPEVEVLDLDPATLAPGAADVGGRIDVEKFNFWYGEKQALFDIDWRSRRARSRRSSGRRAAASPRSCARSTA